MDTKPIGSDRILQRLMILRWCWWWAGWHWSVALTLGGMSRFEENRGAQQNRGKSRRLFGRMQEKLQIQPRLLLRIQQELLGDSRNLENCGACWGESFKNC